MKKGSQKGRGERDEKKRGRRVGGGRKIRTTLYLPVAFGCDFSNICSALAHANHVCRNFQVESSRENSKDILSQTFTTPQFPTHCTHARVYVHTCMYSNMYMYMYLH